MNPARLFFKRIGSWLARNPAARADALIHTANSLRSRSRFARTAQRAQALVDSAEVLELRAEQLRRRAGV